MPVTMNLELLDSEGNSKSEPNFSNMIALRDSELLKHNVDYSQLEQDFERQGPEALYKKFGNTPTIEGVKHYLKYAEHAYDDSIEGMSVTEKEGIVKITKGSVNKEITTVGGWIEEVSSFIIENQQ